MDLTLLANTPPWEWPQSAGETIAEALRKGGGAAPERIVAAELAGDLVVMNDDMADLLLSIVRAADEPPALRATAAIALGPALEQADTEGYDDPIGEPPITLPVFQQIQAALRDVGSDTSAPKQLRRRALEASVRASEEWHRKAVLAAYSSGDDEWKLTAAFCMRYLPGFEVQILEALDSANPDVHFEAVCAAGQWQLDQAWPHIAAILDSLEPEKRLLLAAIQAAATIRPHEAWEILEPFTHSEDAEIADAAEEALEDADLAAEYQESEDEDDEDEL